MGAHARYWWFTHLPELLCIVLEEVLSCLDVADTAAVGFQAACRSTCMGQNFYLLCMCRENIICFKPHVTATESEGLKAGRV